MEIGSWVEPEVELLLSVSLALAEHISVEDIGVPTEVPQEFKVDFIMGWPL